MDVKQNGGEKQSLLYGALILSIAAVLSRVAGGLLFKIPLQQLGETVFSHFDNSYEIFSVIYTVSTAGLPIAVSRMVSQSIALGKVRDVRVIRRVSNRIFLLTGVIGMAAMLIAAQIYPKFIGSPDSTLTMMIMAPSVVFCCMVSAYRGICEGTGNMYPTAISQIMEVVGKLCFGWGLAWGAQRYTQWCFETGRPGFGGVIAATAEEAFAASSAYVAAAAMIGVTIGSIMAFLYVWIRHRIKGDGIPREALKAAPHAAAGGVVLRALVAMAVPVALGTLATQITSIIDTVSLKRSLAVLIETHGTQVSEIYSDLLKTARAEDVLSFLIANRGTAMTYVTLVPSITLTLGISSIPVISSAWALNNKAKLQKTVSTVLRITVLVSMPAGFGMSVLSGPLMNLIYGAGRYMVAADMLKIYGPAVVFICLVGPINAMLQAMGRSDIPAKIVLVGGAVKLVLNIILVGIPEINIMGAAYSTLACYAVMVVMSLAALRKVADIRMQLRRTFVRPAIASIGCCAAAWVTNLVMSQFVSGRISAVVAIAVAAVFYVILLFFTKTLQKDDILLLPKGQKVAEVLEKYGWIG